MAQSVFKLGFSSDWPHGATFIKVTAFVANFLVILSNSVSHNQVGLIAIGYMANG